ncbi:hypothetical protein RRJ93_003232 [Vibrio parahaemolyticus]|nr:hypothetical protein [Vibrio parahaemolyticus]ELI5425226.1 hypothetical protein [Vibrio parahaemolyticus]
MNSGYCAQAKKFFFHFPYQCISFVKSFFESLKEIIQSPSKLFNTFIKLATSVLAFACLAVYLIMMIVKPWYDGKGSWQYVHDVWSNWQTFNAAMIAFAASLLAVYAAKYVEERKRKRHLLAARAMLPIALSDLTSHNKKLARFFMQVYDYSQNKMREKESEPSLPERNINEALVIFSNCMQHESMESVEFMAKILSMSQYIHDRARSEHENRYFSTGRGYTQSIASQLCELAKMQALINKLFIYGKNLKTELDVSNPTHLDVSTGLINLHVDDNYPEVYEYLATMSRYRSS